MDTITLSIKLSPDDLAKVEATLTKLGVKPVQIKPPKDADAKLAEGSVGRLRQQIKGLEKDIEKLDNVKAIRGKQKEMADLEKQLDGMLGKKDGFAAMLPSVGALAPVAGVGALIGVALKRGVDNAIALDKEVRNIGSLGIKNFEEFGDAALEISRKVPDSAANIARGAYDAISAGIDPKRANQFVEVAAKTGVAGLTDTGTAVNALTSILNAYKLGADQTEKISDMMFTTVNLGKVTFEELNASIAAVVPTASSVGVGFDQVGGAIATMTKQGVPAQQSATKLNQALVEVQKPGKELEGLMKRAGIESGVMSLKTIGLQGTLKKLGDQADKEGKTLTQYFGSVDAGSAALLLTGQNAQMAAADLAAMQNAAGAMGAAFEVNAGSAENQLKLMQNNIDAVATQAVQALGPAFNTALEMVTGAFQQINEWLESAEQRMARLKRQADEEKQKDYQEAASQVRTRMANLQVTTLAELDALKKMDRAEIEQFYKRKGILAATKKLSDETYAQIRQNLYGTGTDALRSGWGADADKIIAILNEVPKAPAGKPGAGPVSAEDADKARKERLRRELQAIDNEADLALLRAQKEGDSEKVILGIKEYYLNQRLAAQKRFSAEAVDIQKTEHDIARNLVEQEYAGGKQIVEESIEWYESQLKKLKEKLNSAPTDSPIFAALSDQIETLEQKLAKLRDELARTFWYEDSVGRKSKVTVDKKSSKDETPEEFQQRISDELKAEYEKMKEAIGPVGMEIGQVMSETIAAGLDFSKTEMSFKQFTRRMLAIAVDYALRQLLIDSALGFTKELATKGPLGIITGGIISGLILGMAGQIKSAITGYASGGVIVGEGGQPEIIAPARDFSSFAGQIVMSAMEYMRQASARMLQAEQRSASAAMSGQFTFAPAEVEFRGDKAIAMLRVQAYRDQVASMGM